MALKTYLVLTYFNLKTACQNIPNIIAKKNAGHFFPESNLVFFQIFRENARFLSRQTSLN